MRRRLRLAIAALVVGVAVPAAPIGPAAPAAAAAPDLYFSEYVEGSSLNKAVEIFNGTGSPVDLDAGGYELQISFNGGSFVATIDLTGTIAPGDVHVVADDGADPAILAVADQTPTNSLFNGDDAVSLVRATTTVDVIGQVGVDPGSEWGSGDTSTQNNTIRRKAAICSGDPDGSDPFDPAVEWDGFANNSFDGLGAHTAICGPVPPVINEFLANHTGSDVNEYVEVAGAASTDLSNLTVLAVEGDGSGAGTIDDVIPIGTTDAEGIHLADLPPNTLENGSQTILLVDGFTGSAGQDIDTDNDGVLDADPWTAILDSVAVIDGGGTDLTYGVPELGPDYDGVSPFHPGGASRIPNALDTDAAADWVRNDFDLAGIPPNVGTPTAGEALNTPGAPNQAWEPPAGGVCGDPVTPISGIQGSGLTTPVEGEVHSVEATVTRLAPGLNGLYVQEEDADVDGDPATSEGIFVFLGADPDAALAVGDQVRVTGTAGEFRSSGSSQTQLTGSPIVTPCAAGTVPAATPVAFPLPSVSDLEPVEGMVVALSQALVISEYFNFDRFGETVLALPVGPDDRPMNPTAVVSPGDPATARADLNDRSRITVDDADSRQNPPRLIHPGNGAPFDNANSFRGGDTVAGLEGVVDETFGRYKIQPTTYGAYTGMSQRPTGPPAVGGDLTVASMNVLNYFLTTDDGGSICGPSMTLGCRGADNPEEFARQRPKTLAALAGLDADIVGLVEIENTTGVEPAEDLVSGLNGMLGAGTYAYIDTATIGTDAIRVGLIYKPSAVTPLGPFAVLDSSVDPRFIDTKNRPVLAQTFEVPSGRRFTVAVNHLKSKGSPCDDVADPNAGDEQGNCNGTRTSAAAALADWLADDPTGTGAEDSLIIGDLNAYDKEDPITTLDAAGHTDLIARFGGENAYSYVFDGEFGYLDHGLASSGILAAVTGAAEWHINADEPDVFDYNTSFRPPEQTALWEPNEFRSSDHDPVLIGLDTTGPDLAVELDTTVLWPPNHKYRTVNATVTAADATGPDPAVRLVSVTSNESDNGADDGNTHDDIVIIDDTTFELRAERSGSGTGRIYTIAYEAQDAAGNVSTATAEVAVPLRR